MAALVVVVLLVGVGAIILLAGGGDEDVELTEAQRTDALLTDGDIGNGFTESDAEDTSSTPDIEASSGCEEVLDRLDADGTNPFGNDDDPPGLVERSFSDESSTTVEQGLAPTIDVVSTYRELIEACDELSFVDDESGATATVMISEGTDPAIGDDSVRLDADFSVEGGDGETLEFSGMLVAWTRDGTDGLLSFTDGFSLDTGEPVPVDDDLVDDVTQRADERLAEVIDEA